MVSAGNEATLVTVGVPCFNGAEYLSQSLHDIRSQSYENLEIIVADNASTDESLAIARQHARDDPRIRTLTSQTNRGAAWNYNRLVAEANGSFFKWQAHDDRLESSAIASCLSAFVDRPEVVLVYPESRIIDSDGLPVRDHHEDLGLDISGPLQRSTRLLWRVRMCHAVFGLFRTSALLNTSCIQPFDSSDVTLLLEASLLGRLVEVPDRSFLRRRHAGDSRTAQKSSLEVAQWFDTNATSGGRSLPLLKSYQRAAKEHASTRIAHLALASSFAVIGPATEARWHIRRRRRTKR